MSGKIICFIPFGTNEETVVTVRELRKSALVSKIYVVCSQELETPIQGVEILVGDVLTSGKIIHQIAQKSDSEYVLIYTKTSALTMGQSAIERFAQVAADTQSGLVYSNYCAIKEGKTENLPVIDYQEGSLRDDFNFGSVLFYDATVVKDAVKEVDEKYENAGLYALRLAVAARAEFMRIPEFLYTEEEMDTRKSGEKIFDYVDPRNRAVQIEMEEACTEHLKRIGAYLEPKFTPVAFGENDFPVEASVVIPVRDRVKTVEDAIKSALSQKAGFDFNLIIVDNYSTEGTTEII